MRTVTTDVVSDLGYSWRSLRRNRRFAAVVVLTLALGIGASVTIFSAARALITEALSVEEPERLVSVDLVGQRGMGLNPTYRDLGRWESEVQRLVVLGGYTFGEYAVGDGSRTSSFLGSRVTAGFFPALGAHPLLGRTLLPEDSSPGSGPVVVVTERLWRGRFGGDPEIIGRSIRLDGRPHTVIGVVPTSSRFPAGADLWVPLVPAADEAATLHLNVIGRLRPDATAQGVRAALETVQHGLDAERVPGERAGGVRVASLVDREFGNARSGFLLLRSAVVLLLLIAATNAAGLMLVRATRRRREIAVRTAVGASRARIVRQILVESVLLSLAAGVLGTLVAYAAIEALQNALPARMSRAMLGWDQLGLDGHAVAFALALSTLTGIAFGVGPALRAVRGDLAGGLREGTSTATPGRGRNRLARVLLSGEVALAMTLLLGAGLLTRSLLEMLRADPGFRAEGVLTVQWALPPERYESPEAVIRFQDALLGRLRAMPGVRSADLVSNLPMSRTGRGKQYRVQGADPGAEEQGASWRPITPGYFETMGISLQRGRQLLAADGPGAPGAAVVSESLVRRHWPDGADPLGQRLEVEGEEWTIVGVARDVHDFGVDRRAEPTIYVPQRQSPSSEGFLALQVAGDPADLAPLVRQEIWSIDPDVAVGRIRTMEQVIRDFLAGERVMAFLIAVFASISLLITVISLFTLVAHFVARRQREIGIRLALGALPRRILIRTMSQGMLSVAVGLGVGLLLAVGAARVLARMLYGIQPLDPAVFVLVPGGVVAVALLASYIPARRAAKLDPVTSLRCE